MLNLLLVEDNEKLNQALKSGLEATGKVRVVFSCRSGEQALDYCLSYLDESPNNSKKHNSKPNVALFDVQLSSKMNGIQAAMKLRREIPRFPVVFYSIQDDETYYRDFRNSGIISHYAYVRKSNYLLPEMISPILKDAVSGRSFIDPDIENRVQEVHQKDKQSPMALLEPNEQIVAQLLAEGKTNQQIATILGFRDKRTISRTNGQIYAVWGLNRNRTDEKIARTRAALIVNIGRLISWDEEGNTSIMDENGNWIPFDTTSGTDYRST